MGVKLPEARTVSAKRLFVALAALALVAIVAAPTAAAHASKTTDDGKLKFVWGWLDEPAYTGTKTKLDLSVRDAATDARITGLTAANFTEAEIHYGDEEYPLGNVSAYSGAKSGTFAGPGNYTAANSIYLTKPGLYVLHLAGNVNGIDFEIEIPHNHEVEPREEIEFPPSEESADLEARIAALEQKVLALEQKAQTASTAPATLTPQPTGGAPVPSLGLLAALAAVGLALVLLRRRQA